MKAKLIILIIGFFLLSLNSLKAQVIDIHWNTFLGGGSGDSACSIALDSSGNIYVTGYSNATWGSPINAHSGDTDAFVAKLNSSGDLQWNTFMGSTSSDSGRAITVDTSGNVLVAGYSDATWGTPVNAYAGYGDAFVAKLNTSGVRQWHTFMGSEHDDDYGYAIAVDTSGNVLVAGRSGIISWGTPVNGHAGWAEAFVAKLNTSGVRQWHTFMGSASSEYGYAIAVDTSGNVLVAGYSGATWGTPINAYSGGNWEAFVAKLNSSGVRLWNTFMGSASSSETGFAIAVDTSGNVYVSGYSYATWGTPVNSHAGYSDAFVAKLNTSGVRQWHTFMGSASGDEGYAIAVDTSGNVLVAGFSDATWGTPVNTYSGNYDAFVAKLNSSGDLQWNTFMGSTSSDSGRAITVDTSGNVLVAGYSDATWGSPINPYVGSSDAFVARLSTHPIPDIKTNGSDGPISITQSDTLQIRVSLNPFGLTDEVDYWLACRGPSGWVHYNNTTKKWETGLGVTHQGPLMDLNNKKVFQSSGLAPGNYTFYFGVDMVMDGKVSKSSLYKDEVQVTVTQ